MYLNSIKYVFTNISFLKCYYVLHLNCYNKQIVYFHNVSVFYVTWHAARTRLTRTGRAEGPTTCCSSCSRWHQHTLPFRTFYMHTDVGNKWPLVSLAMGRKILTVFAARKFYSVPSKMQRFQAGLVGIIFLVMILKSQFMFNNNKFQIANYERFSCNCTMFRFYYYY